MGISNATRSRRQDKDIVLDRDDDGQVYVALPRTLRHYGIEELDWGYIGPATAELALNILNWLLPPGVDGEAAIQCEEGECSAAAWRLHRAFMAEFLVRVPYAGGCLAESDIRRWVIRQFEEASEAPAARSPRRWLTSLIQR